MFLLTKQNPWRWIATNGYLQRIFWGPVDGCVDQTASTVIDEKNKEKKENGVHDCNFQIGDDPRLIRCAKMLMYCCLQLLTGLGQRLSRASVSLHSLTFLKGWFQVVCSVVKIKLGLLSKRTLNFSKLTRSTFFVSKYSRKKIMAHKINVHRRYKYKISVLWS